MQNNNFYKLLYSNKMDATLETLDAVFDYDDKISSIANWAEEHYTPTNSEEAIALEVNSIEIFHDAKSTLSEEDGGINRADAAAITLSEIEAFRQKRAELEAEEEKWFTMKKRHDQILIRGLWTSQYDSVPNMADLVVKNCYYLCLGGAFITAGEFYLNPINTWNPLEKVMASIQKEYGMMAKAKGNVGVPWQGHLIPGFIVGARCHDKMEFHRAKILAVLTDDKYKVQFLDYGDIVIVPFKEIRYLPLKFLQTMEFQAIRCTLRFNEEDRPWTPKEGERLRRMILNKAMAVHFKQNYKVEDGMIWEVCLHLYDEAHRKITDFHVERRFFDKCRRSLLPSEAKETDTDPDLQISRFRVGRY